MEQHLVKEQQVVSFLVGKVRLGTWATELVEKYPWARVRRTLVVVLRRVETLMEVCPLVRILREQIVPIKMIEEIVVNLMVVMDQALGLKEKKMRKYSKMLILIKELHGAPNDERRELYGVGLTNEREETLR